MTVILTVPPSDMAFANPLQGLLQPQPAWPAEVLPGWPPEGVSPPKVPGPPPGSPKHPYGSVIRWYVPWNAIERSAGDDAGRLLDYASEHWTPLMARGLRVAPQVYLDFPQRRERRWPADLPRGEWDHPQFVARAEALIEKMGAAWDGDPRIAWVQTGIIGLWGEHHTPYPTPDQERRLGDAFDAAFPRTHLLRRYPRYFRRPGWGLYWDSFGCTNGKDALTYDDTAGALRDEPDMWRGSIITGEISFDYCGQFGSTPDEAVTVPTNVRAIVGQVYRFHATALGWIGAAVYSGAGRAGLDAVQRALGARFVVESLAFDAPVRPGSRLVGQIRISNQGAAPFLHDWPLEFSLLEPGSRRPVVRKLCRDVDVRRWLPGDQWDGEEYRYVSPAASQDVPIDLDLPHELPAGCYELAVALLDPTDGRPGFRFANRSYYSGGRTPLARVGVAAQVDDPTIDSSSVDEIAVDGLRPYTWPV